MKKKLFSILALLAMTVSGAWADDVKVQYALTEGDTFTSGQTAEVKNDAEAVVATITYGESGGADFKAAKADAHVTDFTAFTEGNGINGNKEGGTFYTIAPVYDGTIDVAVVLNADKAFYVEEDGTALTDYNGITVDAKYYGTYSFKVSAGKSYKIYCAGSKLGFYGFEYTYTPSQSDPEDQPAGDGVEYALSEGTSVYGTVAFKNAAGEAIVTAQEGQTVTVEITPAEGYVVNEVSGQWYAAVAAARRADIDLLNAVTLTPVEGEDNQWTFTMQRANVKISATYKKLLQDAWIEAIADQTYTGEALQPAIVVKDGETTLVENTDYTVAYSDNTQPGTATVTITAAEGSENYSGTATATFTILTNKTALDAAITDAETYYNSISESYPEIAAELLTAINTAKEVQGNAEATQTEVETATTTLNDAVSTAQANVQAAADQAAADAVIAKINAIGTVEYTEDSKALIDAAREAYDALTDAQKDLVSEETLKVLTDAEAEYERLKNITTGIGAVKAGNKADVWYDLSGRRVLQPTKGIYVRNGKKVVIK